MRTDEKHPLVDPVASALGLLVIEWNQLLESLGVLFATILDPHEAASPVGLAVWNTLSSDRTQITVLLAASKARFADGEEFDAIKWLCNRTNDLANTRNDAVHAPLTIQWEDDGSPKMVVPSEYFGNRRAKNLGEKDLLEHFEKCRADAQALKFYARNVHARFPFGKPLPAKPTLQISAR